MHRATSVSNDETHGRIRTPRRQRYRNGRKEWRKISWEMLPARRVPRDCIFLLENDIETLSRRLSCERLRNREVR